MNWTRGGRLASGFLLGCLALVTLGAALAGHLEHGALQPSSGRGSRELSVIPWLAYATANSVMATGTMVVVSSTIGVLLGMMAGDARSGTLLRWFEFFSTLPAFLVTVLLLSNPTAQPLAILVAVVTAQRTLQVAALVNRAELERAPQTKGSLYPVPELGLAQLRRRLPLLWIAAAHSAVLLNAEHAALALLGLFPNAPDTWITTLCAAIAGDGPVTRVNVGLAMLGVLGVPLALWTQSLPTERKRQQLLVSPEVP